MTSHKTFAATLLTAVNQARDLANYIANQPFDFAAVSHLTDTAKNICYCAHALRNKELVQLGRQLIRTSERDLSSATAVSALDSTIATISVIAEKLDEHNPAESGLEDEDGEDERPVAPEDPFSSLTGMRMVLL